MSERDGFYVFVALMKGTPAFHAELCLVPMELVAEVIGG